MQNGGGFEGGVFLGKGLEKGLEGSGVNRMGLESSRATALGFVLDDQVPMAVWHRAMDRTRISWARGWSHGEGLEASGEHGRGLESSRNSTTQLQYWCYLMYTHQCYEWYCIFSSDGHRFI
jgi:hypothetical protein